MKCKDQNCDITHISQRDVTQPIGLFNEVRIIVRDGQVEHWLNNEQVVEYDLNGNDFKNRVADETTLFVSGDEDDVVLRFLSDALPLEVGETAKLEVHNRGAERAATIAGWSAPRNRIRASTAATSVESCRYMGGPDMPYRFGGYVIWLPPQPPPGP